MRLEQVTALRWCDSSLLSLSSFVVDLLRFRSIDRSVDRSILPAIRSIGRSIAYLVAWDDGQECEGGSGGLCLSDTPPSNRSSSLTHHIATYPLPSSHTPQRTDPHSVLPSNQPHADKRRLYRQPAMDPLSLLRDCVAHQKPWRIEGEEVVFGDGLGAHRVKKDEPTAWRKMGRKGQCPVPSAQCHSRPGRGVVASGGWDVVCYRSNQPWPEPKPNPQTQQMPRTFTS